MSFLRTVFQTLGNQQFSAQCTRLISTSSLLSAERGINKVQLLGRVGNIPKEFQNESRRLVAFPLATVSSFRTRNEDGTEGYTSKTTWHSINVFRPSLQDTVMKYVQKGSRVYLSGRINNSKYTKEDGTEKYLSVVIAEDIIHLQSPRSVNGQEPATQSFEEMNDNIDISTSDQDPPSRNH